MSNTLLSKILLKATTPTINLGVNITDNTVSSIDEDQPLVLTATGLQGSIQINANSLLLPRCTTVERNAIVSPSVGLQVYDTDLLTICIYNGSYWVYPCYAFLALNNQTNQVSVAGTTLTDFTVSYFPSAQEVISVSSGIINIQPGLYRVNCMCTFIVTNSANVERSSTISFRKNGGELFRNSTGIGWIDNNNTTGSTNLNFIFESTAFSDNYTFLASSDVQGTTHVTSAFRATIERLR